MNHTRTSRYLCRLLRHHPEAAGIILDAHGWADVEELIAKVNPTHPLDRALLEEIVRTDNKQRYSFNADHSKIRANQGHSIPVDVDLEEAEPPEISRAEVKNVLEACGISEESVKAFEEKYNEEFGLGVGLSAQNLVDAKRFEVRTPDVVVHVNPERSDLVETRVIDGVKYLLIRADEGVAVNGVNIAIGAEEQ